MIRNITVNDAPIIKKKIGMNVDGRHDIDYSHSGISFNDDGGVDSIIIFGTRTLTEYYEGSVPNDDYLDDSSSSHEIIGYYSTDGTDKDMHKTFYPFARRLN